jgi:hypothetical protein
MKKMVGKGEEAGCREEVQKEGSIVKGMIVIEGKLLKKS